MLRIVDAAGNVSIAGTSYRAGRSWATPTVDVSIVGGSVQLAKDGKVIRSTRSATTAPTTGRRARQLGGAAPADAPPTADRFHVSGGSGANLSFRSQGWTSWTSDRASAISAA